jgi:hypothetical protein
MGALFIKFLEGQYGFAGVLTQVFRAAKNLLGKKLIPRRTGLFFETAEAIPPIAVKCLGTRCESGTVAPL